MRNQKRTKGSAPRSKLQGKGKTERVERRARVQITCSTDRTDNRKNGGRSRRNAPILSVGLSVLDLLRAWPGLAFFLSRSHPSPSPSPRLVYPRSLPLDICSHLSLSLSLHLPARKRTARWLICSTRRRWKAGCCSRSPRKVRSNLSLSLTRASEEEGPMSSPRRAARSVLRTRL